MREFPRCLPATYPYTEKVMDAANRICTKMQALTSRASPPPDRQPAPPPDRWLTAA